MHLLRNTIKTGADVRPFFRRLALILWLVAMAGLGVSHLFTDPIPLGIFALVGLISFGAIWFGFAAAVPSAEDMFRHADAVRRQRSQP